MSDNSTSMYENQKFNLRITDKDLMIGDTHIVLSNISTVEPIVKRLPLWPGVVLLVWGCAVFYNDTLPAVRGLEANHNFFKYAIVVASVCWFVIRSYAQPDYQVHIAVSGDEVHVATTEDPIEADEIITAIKTAL